MLFEDPDLVADRRGREAKLRGRLLEAEMSRRGLESTQRTKGWKPRADVIEAVALARTAGILTEVRSGGHNVAGSSLCEGGS